MVAPELYIPPGNMLLMSICGMGIIWFCIGIWLPMGIGRLELLGIGPLPIPTRPSPAEESKIYWVNRLQILPQARKRQSRVLTWEDV
jgi:hypothetical protein